MKLKEKLSLEELPEAEFLRWIQRIADEAFEAEVDREENMADALLEISAAIQKRLKARQTSYRADGIYWVIKGHPGSWEVLGAKDGRVVVRHGESFLFAMDEIERRLSR